jgi:hypothetical protein
MNDSKNGPLGQLRNADACAVRGNHAGKGPAPWSSHPRARQGTGWSLGKAYPHHLALKCPCCAGWHRVPKTSVTGGDTARVLTCPHEFRQTPDRWINVVEVGQAPEHIKRGLADGNPLGDVADAFELLRRDDRSTPGAGRKAPHWFDPNVPIPDDAYVGFAISSLKAVGYRDEANAIARIMKPFRKLGLYGYSTDKRWRAVGPLAMQLIFEALTLAWRAGGR